MLTDRAHHRRTRQSFCLRLVAGVKCTVAIVLASVGLLVLARPAVVGAVDDPALVGRWDAPLQWPVVAVHAIVLHTGKVLFYRGDESTPRAYTWDPATEQTAFTPPGTNIFCSGHSFLADGRVFVSGGAVPGQNRGPTHTIIFDPTTSGWTLGPEMRKGRFYPTNVAMGDGRALIFSGRDALGHLNELVESYDPDANRLDLLAAASKVMEFYPRMHLLPDGRVLHVGEETETEALDPLTQTWQLIDVSDWGVRTEGGAVMLPPGQRRFMIFGGGPEDGIPTETAEIIDMAQPSPAWRYTSPMHFARTHLQAVILPDGKVMVAGGVGGADGETPVLPAEIFDPNTEIWSIVAALATQRGYHSTGVLLPDGRVLWAGANGNPTREVYSPAYLFRGARPVIAAVPTSVDYGETLVVQTPDAADITSVVFMRPGASTHAGNMEQRYVQLDFVQPAAGILHVSAPVQPNVAPPGYYMLFLVDGDGIPSVAPFVRLGSALSPTTTTTTTRTTTTTTTLPLPPGSLLNGGFEQGQTGWSGWTDSQNANEAVVTTIGPCTGARSLQMFDSSTRTRNVYQNVVIRPGVPLRLELVARARNLGTNQGRPLLEWRNGTTVLGTASSTLPPGTYGCTSFTLDATPPAGATQVRVRLTLGPATTGVPFNDAQVWYDEVRLVEVGASTSTTTSTTISTTTTVASTSTTTTTQPPPPPGVVNGDFEQGQTGWSGWTDSQNANEAVVTTVGPCAGIRSLQMFDSSTRTRAVYQEIPVQAGEALRLQLVARARNLGSNQGRPLLEWRNGTTVLSTASLTLPPGTYGCTAFTLDATAPLGATRVRVRLTLGPATTGVPYNDAQVWYDTVTLSPFGPE
jgi:hypothetical protein